MRDLHLHLSGATSPVLLYEMVNETGLRIKAKNYWEFCQSITMKRDEIRDLNDYLVIAHVIDEAQSSPRAVKMSFYNSYINAFMNGCTYLELRWNPYKRSQNLKIDLDRLIVSARAGFEKARSIFGIGGGMLFCLGRDVSEKANEIIFEKALQYHNKGVLGIDVAGPESKTPLKPEFESFYKTANTLGMITTIHAGEPNYEGVDDTLNTVIDKYKVQRIGHGIQIHKYPKLMKMAAARDIEFEICITSNLMTQSVKDYEEFAKIFKILEENQLRYTICTDATFSLETNLKNEYKIFNEIKHLSKII